MAYSSAQLSADEIAWRALDLPFLSNNALYASGISAGWDSGTISGTVASATDDEDSFEAKFTFDGNPDLLSKDNAASTTHSIVYDCSSSPVTLDWFGVMNHNLHTLACTSLRLQVSNGSSFGGGDSVETVSATNVAVSYSDDRRITDVILTIGGGSTPLRLSNVPYLRVQITCSSGVPDVGQVIFGRRRQQPYHPDTPFDRGDYRSLMAQAESVNGVLTSNMRSLAPYHLDAMFHHDTDALQSEILDFWDDIEGGEQPFFWFDYPNSDPDRFYMMHLDNPALSYPYAHPNSRDWRVIATEQGHDTFYRDTSGI